MWYIFSDLVPALHARVTLALVRAWDSISVGDWATNQVVAKT